MGSLRELLPHLRRHFHAFVQVLAKSLSWESEQGRHTPVLVWGLTRQGIACGPVQERVMRSTLNNACISALLCGAVLVALPAVAAGDGGATPDNATTTSNTAGNPTGNTTGNTA